MELNSCCENNDTVDYIYVYFDEIFFFPLASVVGIVRPFCFVQTRPWDDSGVTIIGDCVTCKPISFFKKNTQKHKFFLNRYTLIFLF